MFIYDWRKIPRALSPDQKSEDIPFTEHEFIERWAKKAAGEFGEDSLALEIGAYCGCSTAILAQFFRVLTIDMWYPLENYRDETIGDNFVNFMQMWKQFKLKARVYPLLGSTTYLKAVLPPLAVVFCFIDGDHSYDGAVSDLNFCQQHLVPGGYLVAHDYIRANTVKQAVDEFAARYSYEILEILGDGVVALRRPA